MRSEVTGDSHSPPGLSCFAAFVAIAVRVEKRRLEEKVRRRIPLFLKEGTEAAAAAATRTTAATAVEVEARRRWPIDGDDEEAVAEGAAVETG